MISLSSSLCLLEKGTTTSLPLSVSRLYVIYFFCSWSLRLERGHGHPLLSVDICAPNETESADNVEITPKDEDVSTGDITGTFVVASMSCNNDIIAFLFQVRGAAIVVQVETGKKQRLYGSASLTVSTTC